MTKIRLVPPKTLYLKQGTSVAGLKFKVSVSTVSTIPVGSHIIGDLTSSVVSAIFTAKQLVVGNVTTPITLNSLPITTVTRFNSTEVGNKTLINSIVVIGSGTPSQKFILYKTIVTPSSTSSLTGNYNSVTTRIILSSTNLDTNYYVIPTSGIQLS